MGRPTRSGPTSGSSSPPTTASHTAVLVSVNVKLVASWLVPRSSLSKVSLLCTSCRFQVLQVSAGSAVESLSDCSLTLNHHRRQKMPFKRSSTVTSSSSSSASRPVRQPRLSQSVAESQPHENEDEDIEREKLNVEKFSLDCTSRGNKSETAWPWSANDLL